MYPLPPISELNFLLSGEIIQVARGPYTLHIHFVGERMVVAEGIVEYIDEIGRVDRHDVQEAEVQPFWLPRLLSRRIVGLDVDDDAHVLSCTLDDGPILRILSEEGPYECGQIHADGDVIIF